MPSTDGYSSTDPSVSELASEPMPAPSGPVGVEPYQSFGAVEYLLWKIKDAPAPPTQLTIPFTVSGLNQEQSSINLPGTGIDYGGRSGGRVTAGYWFDADHTCGIEGSFFQLENRNGSYITAQQANLNLQVTVIQNIQTQSITNGILLNTITQVPVNVALPSTLTVSASGSAGPTDFWGGEINGRTNRWTFGGLSVDFIGGFRFLSLAEEFVLNQSILLQAADPNTIFVNGPLLNNAQLNGLIPAPVVNLHTITATQSFNNISTRNTFYGAQAGASWDWRVSNRISFEGWGKLAVGPMIENFTITSVTSTSIGTGGAGGTTVAPGGILPVTAFLDQGRTRYAVVPELNFKLAWHWTPNIRSTIGFNFLYISSVMRPGDQIQFNNSTTTINISGTQNSVSTIQPAYATKDTDFWAQGLTAGLEFRY